MPVLRGAFFAHLLLCVQFAQLDTSSVLTNYATPLAALTSMEILRQQSAKLVPTTVRLAYRMENVLLAALLTILEF